MAIEYRQLSWVAYLLTGLGGMALGVGLTIKALDKEYEQNLAKEIENSKRYFDRLHKRGEYSDPVAVVGRMEDSDIAKMQTGLDKMTAGLDDMEARIIEEQKYAKINEVDSAVRNIFLDVQTKGPLEDPIGHEQRFRESGRPYIITDREFFDNSTEYEQVNLQYYTNDGVLCEQDDSYVRESDDVVGDDNLLKFGEKSNDKNIVYIRNDRLEREFEVIRVKGSYAETVHGTLEHSNHNRKVPKKRRRGDE